MIQGKVKTLIPFIKDSIKTRVNSIDFESPYFKTYDLEVVENYISGMLEMLNGIYQDYLAESITMESVLEINLKNCTYKII